MIEIDRYRIIKKVHVSPATPELIAEMFACLDSEEQAKFFNHVAEVASKWSGGGFCLQLQYITDEDGLTLAGRRVMQEIGDYSHWGITPQGDRSFIHD